MKKVSKAAKIREAISANEKPRDIAKRLKVPVSAVYTEGWKLRKEAKKKVTVNRTEAMLAKKVGISIEQYAEQKMLAANSKIVFEHKPVDPALEFLRDELASVERQIDTLNTVASFLTIRLRQMEQNNG